MIGMLIFEILINHLTKFYHAGIIDGKSKYCCILIQKINKTYLKNLKKVNGILVPGGFGNRGIEGKILAACMREKMIFIFRYMPRMQISVIEYARNVINLTKANSTEFDLKQKIQLLRLLRNGKTHRKKYFS